MSDTKKLTGGLHSGNPYDANDWIVAPGHWALITDSGYEEHDLLCSDCVAEWVHDHFDADYEGEESGYVQCGGRVEELSVTCTRDLERGDRCVVCGDGKAVREIVEVENE